MLELANMEIRLLMFWCTKTFVVWSQISVKVKLGWKFTGSLRTPTCLHVRGFANDLTSPDLLIAGETRGTLRWQAPELLAGTNAITSATDVYAYAITCVEVLNRGELPWRFTDDHTIRKLVLGMLVPLST